MIDENRAAIIFLIAITLGLAAGHINGYDSGYNDGEFSTWDELASLEYRINESTETIRDLNEQLELYAENSTIRMENLTFNSNVTIDGDKKGIFLENCTLTDVYMDIGNNTTIRVTNSEIYQRWGGMEGMGFETVL